jgi:hypothetical protein
MFNIDVTTDERYRLMEANATTQTAWGSCKARGIGRKDEIISIVPSGRIAFQSLGI